MKTGKHEAQSYDDMTESMELSKATGLELKRGQSLYKRQSGEYQEEKLRELVIANTSELVNVITREKVSLEDIETVKVRTIAYLRACAETATFPTSLGLARSLGYSDRALRDWRNNKPDSETAQWLEMFYDLSADVLNQSALKNNANGVVSIFLNKALYGYRDGTEITITPNPPVQEEIVYSAKDIRKRYLPYSKETTTEGRE